MTARDNRLFVEAVLYRLRTGVLWRDLPERFGCGSRRSGASAAGPRAGVWKRAFQHLAAEADTVNRGSATVLLTTTLAHGSGEWVAATWPVCRLSDLSHPKVMGAALTHARRYGLFTLVGRARSRGAGDG